MFLNKGKRNCNQAHSYRAHMTIVKLLVNVLKSMIYFKYDNVFCIKKFKQEWHASLKLFLKE